MVRDDEEIIQLKAGGEAWMYSGQPGRAREGGAWVPGAGPLVLGAGGQGTSRCGL